VIVDLNVPDVDRVFHYAVPEALAARVAVGHRVVVPFGRQRRVEGYIVGFADGTDRLDIKPIEAAVDDRPLLSPAAIAVAKWMRDYYLCTLAQALQCFLPPGARLRSKRQAKEQTYLGYEVADAQGAQAALPRLWARAPKQAEALRRLLEAGKPLLAAELEKNLGIGRGTLAGLAAKGLVRPVTVRVGRRPPSAGEKAARTFHALSPEQETAVRRIAESIAGGGPAVHLVQGVTGSGKTEIYLQAIREATARGKGAILLVPEIALTGQTVAYLESLFGSNLAVLHSRLSVGERYDQWHMIHSGEVSIVVGARSAVFAPVRNLGLIIVDEEHETSYKQEEAPRYHAREVARERCRHENATLVLGSATPSLETRLAAEREEGPVRIVLARRVDGRPLPAVRVVDMREELAAGNRSVFSRALLDSLNAALAKGEQAVLFINRRGFASFLLCRECGYVPRCTACEVSLTFHQPDALRCHYCDMRARLPAACPECGGPYLRPFGGGTQRVEHELINLLPHARPVRMDVDTTRRKGSHARILRAFGRGEYDVLIGTQMIAKGLHFPGVTLVGVVSADTGLHFPDFRAAERTFQLLTQVAGRSGRGEQEGRVIIQTYAPGHYAITAAQNHDYEGFCRFELGFRERAGYPPFSALVRCIWSGEDEEAVIRSAQAGWAALQALRESETCEAVGPCPAPLAKLKGKYRWHLLLKGKPDGVRKAALALRDAHPPREDVRLALDVDPANLL